MLDNKVWILVFERKCIGGVHLNFRKAVILFLNNYSLVTDTFALNKALLINSGLSQIRFHNMQFTQMPSTKTFVTQTLIRYMLTEIHIAQHGTSSIKVDILWLEVGKWFAEIHFLITIGEAQLILFSSNDVSSTNRIFLDVFIWTTDFKFCLEGDLI